MPQTTQRRQVVEAGIVLMLQAISLAAFAYLRSLSVLSALLQAIPMLLAAWLWGIRGGLAFTLVALVLNIGLAYLFGFTSVEIFVQHAGLFGILASLLAAVAVGKLGELTRRHARDVGEHTRALENREARVHFMTLLTRVVRASLEAEDMPALLKVFTDQTGELFGADECLLLLRDEAPKNMRPIAVHGSDDKTIPLPPDKPGLDRLADLILSAGNVLAVKDTAHAAGLDAELAISFPRLRSMLCLPLVASGQNLGVLIFGYRQPRPFSPEEIERGELAARHISLAMTKVLLLKDARIRVRELAGLHIIAQAFSVHGDERRTYGTLTDKLAELLGAEICAIFLVNSNTGELQTQVPAHGISDELASALHFPTKTVERIWKLIGKNAFLVNSLQGIPPGFGRLAETFNIKCALVGSLQDLEGRRMGAIFAANKAEGFNEEDVRLIGVFAEQVSMVVQDTLLLSAERKRTSELAVLHAVAAASTEANEEDELIQRVTNLIGESLYQDTFSIFLLDEALGELYLHSTYHHGEDHDSIRIPLGMGITGVVAKTGKPRRVGDVSKTPEYLNLHPLTRSELCLPLIVEGRLIGIAHAESEKLNAFSEQDEELLAILAGQIAIAIQRLRTAKAEHHQANQLERSNVLIRSLADLGARADAAADPDGVMQTLGNELAGLAMSCMIALAEADDTRFTIRYTSLPKRSVNAIARITGLKFYGAAVPLDRISADPDMAQRPFIIPDPATLVLNLVPGSSRQMAIKILKAVGIIETTSICHLPLVIEGKTIGILWMWGEGLHESDLQTMTLFANQVAAALRNARLLVTVQRLAITDELTGIFNRRHFFNLADTGFSRAKRYNEPLAAMIVDIDHFKQFNDRFGHAIGDRVLREVARLLQESLRESDILGRYGGEEFSILLPRTEMKAAINAAERLLKHVAKTPIQTEAGDLHVQLSIGVAGFSKATPTLHALINRADQAMYKAKDAGRNRVATK